MILKAASSSMFLGLASVRLKASSALHPLALGGRSCRAKTTPKQGTGAISPLEHKLLKIKAAKNSVRKTK
jgi:hypothetical protein